MNNEENMEKYDSQLKSVAGQIIEIVQNNAENFSDEEEAKVLLCNSSMQFWIEQNNPKRALVEAQNTLNILKQITEW
jgi:hypothetical protein|tara:strand:+ start:386 stop:616 length:231 start_codon:yes stop_codon:yes gene_type:complete